MRDVAVIGAGMTVFGKYPQKTPEDLGFEAISAALNDAGIQPRQVQVAICGTVYGGWCIGQRILKNVGISNLEVLNVENACATGASAFREAWLRVATGQCDIAIAVGVESMTTSPGDNCSTWFRTASRSVSAIRYRPSPLSPRRSALSLIWCTVSSPEM